MLVDGTFKARVKPKEALCSRLACAPCKSETLRSLPLLRLVAEQGAAAVDSIMRKSLLQVALQRVAVATKLAWLAATRCTTSLSTMLSATTATLSKHDDGNIQQ